MQDEKLDEYQQKVEQMQRLMEETKMVSECKIRQLQTENEALRMHLKLALESLKNPIPPVTLEKRQSSIGSFAEESQLPHDEPISREGSPIIPSDSEPDLWEDEDDDEDDDDTVTWDDSEREAHHMQSHMEDLLGDLTMFKRKLASDHERWQRKEQAMAPKRRALGAIVANNR